jgi:XTP/dITP diphosphohydrolase
MMMKTKKTYCLVTGNDDKWREAERILGGPSSPIILERTKIDLPELQAATTVEVALEKAKAAFASLKRPLIIEDAGIELHALGTFPGPFIKFWEKLGGLASICRAMDGFTDRRVSAVCVLGLVDEQGNASVVEGRTEGTISKEPRGKNGFGWDAIFIPENDTRTFAEMSGEEKDKTSHRRRAWTALAKKLA